MSKLVETSDAGHVRSIRLNRPEKKNALSQQLAWGVIEAVDAERVDFPLPPQAHVLGAADAIQALAILEHHALDAEAAGGFALLRKVLPSCTRQQR